MISKCRNLKISCMYCVQVSSEHTNRTTRLNHCAEVVSLFNNSPVNWVNATVYRPAEISRVLWRLVSETVIKEDDEIASRVPSVYRDNKMVDISYSATALIENFIASLTA